MNKWQQQRGDVSQQGLLDLFANKCGYIILMSSQEN